MKLSLLHDTRNGSVSFSTGRPLILALIAVLLIGIFDLDKVLAPGVVFPKNAGSSCYAEFIEVPQPPYKGNVLRSGWLGKLNGLVHLSLNGNGLGNAFSWREIELPNGNRSSKSKKFLSSWPQSRIWPSKERLTYQGSRLNPSSFTS
jgi:hypothetical protein